MTINTTWLRDRFNLQYNNIFSNIASGLVDEEISMYLTMAHIEIIDEYSDDLDVFEKYRSVLTSYIYDDVIVGSIAATKTRGIDYQTFEFTKDYWRILKEYAITNDNSDGFPIKPIKYDEFNTMSANPFKWPNGLKGWRLDINNDPNTDSLRDVKILFKKQSTGDYIKEYRVVYLVQPEGFDLTSGEIPPQLTNNQFLAEKIVNRAVELATRDYKDNTLSTQIQINKRSE